MSTLIAGYCTLCRSRCGTLSEVDNNRLIKVIPNPDHPNGNAMCMKGKAAPELVHSANRILYPMKRTNPKGSTDPGWVRISWDEALTTVAANMEKFKRESGAEAMAFATTTPSGTSLSDSIEWVERFIRLYGSPNTSYGTEICNWHKDVAHRWTFGCGIPVADYANAELIILWGHNPANTWLAQANAIGLGRRAGGKLIVIDPRATPLAQEADAWLNVNPGTDGALALGLCHLLIANNKFNDTFIRDWTNAPFLVRLDNGHFLREQDINQQATQNRFMVWDNKQSIAVTTESDSRIDVTMPIEITLEGTYEVHTVMGEKLVCTTAFSLLKNMLATYTPEHVSQITGVSIEALNTAFNLIQSTKKIAYHSWSGVAQHTNASQTERSIAILYALTGCFDQIGCNRIYNRHPANIVNPPDLLTNTQRQKALGLSDRPIGPPSQGWVQSRDIWNAVLYSKPYKIRGLFGFGANPLLSQSDTVLAQKALAKLEFFVHADLFETPTAKYADILLPINTPWEREGLRVGFEISPKAEEHIQLRKQLVTPRGESRSDLEVVFDLACRLGLSESFFEGDIDKAWNHILSPIGVTVEELREKPEGIDIPLVQQEKKYTKKNKETGVITGFNTETRRVEIYSEVLLRYNYDPLPHYKEPAENQQTDDKYPLRLTSIKSGFFCHSQHRSITSLRKKAPFPTVYIATQLAIEKNIQTDDWVDVETRMGSASFKVTVDDKLAYDTVIAEFGWWQACPDFGKPSYPVNGAGSSNYNSLISSDHYDPISGSLPLRSFRCQIHPTKEVSPQKRRWEGGRDFRVVALTPEVDGVMTVVFMAEDTGVLPDYEPGQHITISCSIPGFEDAVTRAYSLIEPAIVADRTTYSISVRHQKSVNGKGQAVEGIMSSFINQHLTIGSPVQITSPSGSFIIPLNATQPVVMFAGGIGITPFICYLESIDPLQEGPEIWLYYANRNSQNHAFKSRLDALNKKLARLTIVNIYSNPLLEDRLGEDYQINGHASADIVPEQLLKQNARFYMCGAQSMMDSLAKGLHERSVPKFAIFYEAFRSPVQITPDPNLIHKVTFAKSGIEEKWTTDKGTLLTFGESLGIKMPSGCRVGQCESCSTKVIKGSTTHLNGAEPSDEGCCLTCVAIPTGDIIIDA